jgi:hypothetical protein
MIMTTKAIGTIFAVAIGLFSIMKTTGDASRGLVLGLMTTIVIAAIWNGERCRTD